MADGAVMIIGPAGIGCPFGLIRLQRGGQAALNLFDIDWRLGWALLGCGLLRKRRSRLVNRAGHLRLSLRR